jgi:hypothetical protein
MRPVFDDGYGAGVRAVHTVHSPYKRGVWFENSAHMIPWEEPGKALLSLVTYVKPLAR